MAAPPTNAERDAPGIAERDLERAVAALRAGELVAFPTETVYGLGADASSPAALRRLFAAKGRPADHPVIVHLPSAADLPRWSRALPGSSVRLAERAARRFWPGPLTLVVPRAAHVPDEATGGQDTVGLRVPAHPVALALLGAFGGGVAAPSANRFGRVSPTTAAHVRDEFGDAVALVLDGGPCTVGVESTILSLAGERPALLRPGMIALAELADALGEEVLPPGASPQPRAPGTLASHYAPSTPVALVAAVDAADPASTGRWLDGRPERRIALVWRGEPPPELARRVARVVVMPADALSYARALYATLRALDGGSYDLLAVEEPPALPAWSAIADRLRRAATR